MAINADDFVSVTELAAALRVSSQKARAAAEKRGALIELGERSDRVYLPQFIGKAASDNPPAEDAS